jgi:hypothetical protein
MFYEVELEVGPGPDLDLYFDLAWNLEFTAMDISLGDLPAAVTAAIADDYPGYDIEEDDIEQLERPNGELLYAVELESDEDDVEVIFWANGDIYCEED